MSISDRISRGLFGITFGVAGADTYEFARAWNRGRMTDGGPLDEPYRKSAVLATAISRIAEDAASIEWQLFPDGSEDFLEEHPLYNAWANPNPFMAGRQLWVYTYVIRKLYGEAFWYYPDFRLGVAGGLRASKRSDGAIMLLDPRYVLHKQRGLEVNWSVRVQGEEIPLDREKLTQFKRANPYDPVRGLPELAAVQVEVEADFHAVSWNRSFFRDQNGIPGSALIPHIEDGSTKEARDDLMNRIQNEHRSGRRSVAMLPPGWDWKALGLSQHDMEYGSLREYSREQILAAYGVPPFIAGVLDKANYANAREQKQVYWPGTIWRFVDEIAQVLNHDFLPKVGVENLKVYADWESVKAMTEDLNEKVDTGGKLFAMGFTKRQINERLDLGIDVDDLEDADVGYLSFNLLPVGTLDQPGLESVYARPSESATSDTEEDEDQERSLRNRGSIAGNTEERRTVYWRQLVIRTRSIEERFARVMRAHFEWIKGEALEYAGGLKAWIATQDAIRKQDGDGLSYVLQVFNREEADLRLQRATSPLHAAAMKVGAEAVFAELGLGISFDITDPVAVSTMMKLQDKIVGIDARIESALRRSLTEGIMRGESPQELAERVETVMGAQKSRAMTIARTETGFAFSSGRVDAMEKAGVQYIEWLTTKDKKVRDTHDKLEGAISPIGTADWQNPKTGARVESSLRFPLDPEGEAKEVINCRCVAVPVVEEL